jgi:hypothetical protein
MTRSINIDPVLNGYIVRVGCQTVVFDNKPALLSALSEYLDKPEEVEKRFLSFPLNNPANHPCGSEEVPRRSSDTIRAEQVRDR